MSDGQYSQVKIAALVERGSRFLMGASLVSGIRAPLFRGGYTDAIHARGWQLLHELQGVESGALGARATSQDRQREAANELANWSRLQLERARVALAHHHPAQAQYIFDGLAPKAGGSPVSTVATFLARYASLRDGTDAERGATREHDAAAVAVLAARNIVGVDDEGRLRALIREAVSLCDLPTTFEPDPARRQLIAAQLDAWLTDWRESARLLIRRRDYQIHLGLVARRAAAKRLDVVR